MKRFFIIGLILITLISCSSVFAEDNITNDITEIAEPTDEVKEIEYNQENIDEDIIITNDYSTGTFTELANKINNADNELVLDKNYSFNEIYDESYKNGIIISKSNFIIDGNGHSISNNYTCVVFKMGVSAKVQNGITLKNINFINCAYKEYQNMYDGIITVGSDASQCTLKNCNFTNGGNKIMTSLAVSWNGKAGKIIACNFKNNYAQCINTYLTLVEITDCTFVNNTKLNGGRGVAINGGFINKCIFINNSLFASDDYIYEYGGAVYVSGSNVTNCYFENNYISYAGGAIACESSGNIINCTFINNTAGQFANSICMRTDNKIKCIIENCYFTPDNNNIEVMYGNVEIIKRSFDLICNNITINYKDNCNFSILLNSSEKNSVNNKTIHFIIINKDNFEPEDCPTDISKYDFYMYDYYTVNTDSSGVATLEGVISNLSTGNWRIISKFMGNDNYYEVNNYSDILIKPSNTSITITANNAVVDYEMDIVANVTTPNNLIINEGLVKFYFDDEYMGNTSVVNGIASFKYLLTTSGKHVIKAIFTDSNNFTVSEKIYNFNTDKSEVELSIVDIADNFYGIKYNYTVNVLSNNNLVNEGKIKFYLNNTLIGIVDVVNGKAILTYTANKTGIFNLKVIYDETGNYFSSNKNTTFSIEKMQTSLSGETKFFDEEQTKTYDAKLKDLYNNGVSNQTIKLETIKYSGESKIFTGKTDENGNAVFEVNNLAGGMWIVRGIYDGNDNYIGSTFSDRFIVIRMNTTTCIGEIKNPHKGYPIKLRANILDEFGQTVTDGFAHFYLDGKNLGYIDLSKKVVVPYKTNNNNPILTANLNNVADSDLLSVTYEDILYFEFNPTEAGNHTLNVVYEGTSLYRASSQTINFTVQDGAVPTILTPQTSSINTIYNEGKYFITTLKDSFGNPLIGVQVSVNLNGVKYFNTDKNGQIMITTNGLSPNKYNAIITFAGNNDYLKSTATVKINVKKAIPKLTASKKTFKRKVKTKKYSITLKTNKNKVMKNIKLTLKVNKKTYTAKTNSKGKATFKITKLNKKGTFKSVITFKRDKYYNKVTKTIKIKVN